MSDLEKKIEEKKEELEATVAGEIAKVKRSLAKRMLLWIGWTVAALLVTVPTLLLTTTVNRAALSEVVVAGVW